VRPQSVHGLAGISGVGAHKLEAYGTAILDIVRNEAPDG